MGVCGKERIMCMCVDVVMLREWLSRLLHVCMCVCVPVFMYGSSIVHVSIPTPIPDAHSVHYEPGPAHVLLCSR